MKIVPLFVGRDKSVAALESAMAGDKTIFLVAQLDPGEDDPDADALYDLGVIATVGGWRPAVANELVKRTDLEEETVKEVLSILQAEFE